MIWALLCTSVRRCVDPGSSNTSRMLCRSWLSELLRVDPAKYAADALAHATTHAQALPEGDMSLPDLLRLFCAVP